MWDYVITRSQFSSAGGKQFASDIAEMWNVCSRYVEEPATSMKKLNDVCVLLTLPATAVEATPGLKEVVKDVFEDNDKARAMLGRLELVNISVSDARAILQRRVEAWA